MMWVKSIQSALNYMEEKLLEELSIEEIAKQANFSVFHFQRTFNVMTGITVAEYIRRRRLTLAANELRKSDRKIIDIAHKYGYETPEAFSKAFRKQHGITPTQARKHSGNFISYNRLVIQVNLKGEDPMNYKIVDHEAFQIIGVRKQFSLISEQNLTGITEMWQQVLTDGTDELLSQLNNGPVKGVIGVCDDKSDQSIDYWIGTAYQDEAPDKFEATEIPASKWAIFEVHGAMPDAIQKVWKQIFSEWFPSSSYVHAGTPELEVYSDGDASEEDYYSEIWIPVK
ncbi:AraC family transcriptional regulator [Oceanobacillus sp. CFH 90083]|uniref:AraC family transcriptional regulator n=1 Tax=Oceanobacillus sp. CFH 90083 TaxID=2592336 RepID=UPI00128B74E6|nr:AraC family transcriptional regulator [Oceanobacillus sp. CFH 90083]